MSSVVGLVMALVAVAGCGDVAGRPGTGPAPRTVPPVADTAPCPRGADTPIRGVEALDLNCLSGPGTVRVSAVHGRVEVINVWASWCAPCRQEIPRLEAADRRAAPGVLFLGVDVKDSAAHARAFLAGRHVGYPQVSDPTGRFARALHLFGVPSTVVVDHAGRIRWRHDGELGAAEVRAMLARVRAARRGG